MKHPILLLLCLGLFCASCDPDNNTYCGPVETVAPSNEVAELQTFISSRGIHAVRDDRGFFYVISRPGNEIRPTPCSNVTVSYTGRLTTGAQFDASSGANFNLSRLITGWQEGIPLIGEGGAITLYLPPSFGYGSGGSTGIPPNSILVFDIELIDVQ